MDGKGMKISARSKLSLFLLLLCPFAASAALDCPEADLSDRQSAYFEKLGFPYRLPAGKLALYDGKPYRKIYDENDKEIARIARPDGPRCSVRVDFNQDGIEDFAGMFQYQGDKSRRDNWNLDLVILYTDQASQVKHIIFPYAGQFARETETRFQFFELHTPDQGEIDLYPGSLKTDGPAIISYRNGLPSVVYYWRDDGFAQRQMRVVD